MSHTPTPWKLTSYGWNRRSDGGHPVFFGKIASETGQVVHSGSAFGIFGETEEASEANAAFIVRAVNSHDRLVEALRAILAAGTVSVHVGYDHGSGGGNYVYADAILTDDDAFAKARAALEGL